MAARSQGTGFESTVSRRGTLHFLGSSSSGAVCDHRLGHLHVCRGSYVDILAISCDSFQEESVIAAAVPRQVSKSISTYSGLVWDVWVLVCDVMWQRYGFILVNTGSSCNVRSKLFPWQEINLKIGRGKGSHLQQLLVCFFWSASVARDASDSAPQVATDSAVVRGGRHQVQGQRSAASSIHSNHISLLPPSSKVLIVAWDVFPKQN